jgi:hypothetical protein
MASCIEKPHTSSPPLVYPAPDASGRWVVEMPSHDDEPGQEPITFTGPNALNSALRFAYEEYGSARFFPF